MASTMVDKKRMADVQTLSVKSHEDGYPTGLRLALILLSLMLGTALMALDATIISVATPKISTQFKALDDVGWYAAAYTMLLTATTPIAANFYKYFDPKMVYLGSIAVFEAGSIICAAAPTSPVFIFGRAIAGMGAAGLLQGAFGILTYVCTLEKRPLVLGGVVSLFGMFSSAGPLIGGALIQATTWRWCFWLNLPLGGLVLILVVSSFRLHGVDKTTRSLPLSSKVKKMDLPGVALLIAAVSCLFLALQEGGIKVPWTNARPIGLCVGFVLILALFAVRQWQAGDNATIAIKFLRDRTVVWGSLYLLWDTMASYIAIYYMPFYFQAGLGQTPLRSGVSYMSLAVPQMVGILAGGGISSATGHYMPVILAAQSIAAVGAGLLTTISTHTSTALWGTYMALCGFGLGLGVNVPHVAIQAVMESDTDVFIANGIAIFFAQLGGSIGVPIGNAILLQQLKHAVPLQAPSVAPEAVIDAGPLGLAALTKSPLLLETLRQIWALSLGRVNILLLTAICLSIPMALGMKWLNIKKLSREREARKRRSVTMELQDDGLGQARRLSLE